MSNVPIMNDRHFNELVEYYNLVYVAKSKDVLGCKYIEINGKYYMAKMVDDKVTLYLGEVSDSVIVFNSILSGSLEAIVYKEFFRLSMM